MLLALSCEDVIDVDSGFESPQLVVDAWLNNIDSIQTVRLTQTQDYFDNSFTPAVTGAIVSVTRNGSDVLVFEDQGNGNYTYRPEDVIGQVGDEFTLQIEVDGNTYSSTVEMHRVPPIDSISMFERVDEFGFDDGLYGSLYARDFVGKGDTYWAKTWKNDTLLNKPLELNIIYDAVFDPGTDLDGTYWIRPLREAINPIPEDQAETVQTPYVPGDRIYCEVHSINNDAYSFMNIAFEQMTNGNNAIFALPVANTRGNVVHDTDGSRLLGMFNVAAVSSLGITVE